MALLRHAESGINVDVILGMLPFEEEAVRRGAMHPAGPLHLRLPTPEDLIIMKAVAHRPKDLLDIQGIIRRNPEVDRQRIERWVRAFAETLADPGLWDDVAAMFSQ